MELDFNSDLGESFGLWERGADDAMMSVISSANVACGFHAGDPGVMRSSIAKAQHQGVSVGAHPGLPDLLGFGRRVMDVSPADVRNYVLYQVAALGGFLRAAGLTMHHVKPHGALYMMAQDDPAIARAIAEAVAEYDPRLPIYTLPGTEMARAAAEAGLRAIPEFFADRPIHQDGTVVMFRWWEQFEATPQAVADRVSSLAKRGTVASLEGPEIPITAETVCVHSDTPGAAEIGPAVRAALDQAGVSVRAELSGGLASRRR
jgi:UPF0271 protein